MKLPSKQLQHEIMNKKKTGKPPTALYYISQSFIMLLVGEHKHTE